MKIKRVGCVARRITEKMNASLVDLSVEELVFHVYGNNTNWVHKREVRRALRTMVFPEGWSIALGADMRAVRHARAKKRYFNHGRKA